MFANISNKYVKYGLIAAIVVVLIWGFPHVWGLISPFVVAFIIAIPCQKLVNFLERKCKINRSIGSAFIVLAIVFIIGGILWYLIYLFVAEVEIIIANIPETIDNFRLQLENFSVMYARFTNNLHPEIANFFDNLLTEIQIGLPGMLTPDAGDAARVAGTVAGGVVMTVFYIIIVILSAFFFIKDYDSIINFMRGKLPAAANERIKRIKTSVSSGFLSYIKAQLVIMGITFVIASISLLILGLNVSHALIAAFFIALIDFVPVFGTGAILIPWAIISAIYGEWAMMVGLFTLQAICFVFRNIITPKVLSSQIGVHPLLMIISMFVGLHIFGIVGLIIGPILALLGVSLYNAFKPDEK